MWSFIDGSRIYNSQPHKLTAFRSGINSRENYSHRGIPIFLHNEWDMIILLSPRFPNFNIRTRHVFISDTSTSPPIHNTESCLTYECHDVIRVTKFINCITKFNSLLFRIGLKFVCNINDIFKLDIYSIQKQKLISQEKSSLHLSATSVKSTSTQQITVTTMHAVLTV